LQSQEKLEKLAGYDVGKSPEWAEAFLGMFSVALLSITVTFRRR
jgi:hypothetical protein